MEQFDETTRATHDPPQAPATRPRYRVPVGIPLRDDGRRTGAAVSIIVHVLIIGLLIVPFFLPSAAIERMRQGAGGPGPAGGGGGGSNGTGGEYVETLRFVKLSKTPVSTPTTLPPIPPPVPDPVVVPPKPAPIPAPAATPPDQAALPAPSATVSSVTPGTGGGSGTDGSAGSGPGSGGGIGSGVGAGRGSGTGPGTGGGDRANYSPSPVALFLPPIPWPASVKGFRFTAEFDVDSTGRVVDFTFTSTPDGGYNRRLAAVLRSIRFRPGTRPDGTPVRMKAQLGYDF